MTIRKKLNIWLTQSTEQLPIVCKLRTSLYADKLIERGHNVIWFATAFNHFNKTFFFKNDTDYKLENGLTIKAIKGCGYNKNISLSRYLDHRIIALKFQKIAPTIPKPDVMIASIPAYDLAYQSVIFAKKNQIPIILDIRDPWPDLFLDRVHPTLRGLTKILLCRDFYMIRKTFETANCMLAATETFLEWGLKYSNRNRTWRDKVFPHCYKKSVVSLDFIEKFRELSNILDNKFIIFFVGTISNSYHNPYILLEAAKKLHNIKGIHFIIAGDGELFAALKNDAQNLENVSLTGWLDQKEIGFILQYAKVGVCPSTKSVDLPTNKAFAYLSAGVPIISAFDGDLKSIIEKHHIGFYYHPNDVESLVERIKKLYEDHDLQKKMSENAKRIFYEMFDADKIYEEYAEHVEKIVFDYNGDHSGRANNDTKRK